MTPTIETLKKTFDFPAMFASSGHPIITVIPFTGTQPAFTSCSPDRIEAMIDNWEKAATIASGDDSELQSEARERIQQLRMDLAEVLAVFSPQTQRMIIKLDLHNFELCMEAIPSAEGKSN